MALAAEVDDGGALPDGQTPPASPSVYGTPLQGEDEETQLSLLRAQIAALELGGSESQEAGESQSDPPSTQAQCGVYVLELAGGKFYVGSAPDMGRRIEKHKAKTCVHRAARNRRPGPCSLALRPAPRPRSGAQWTQRHAYVSTVTMRDVAKRDLSKEELGASFTIRALCCAQWAESLHAQTSSCARRTSAA